VDASAIRRALLTPTAEHGFANDWNAMQWADTGVLLMPSGRSAHLEAGYFVGARKPLHILLADQQEPELMYLMATSISRSIAELIHWLAQTKTGVRL
jgi:nucleoside 2-deoxyribosyltransferase